MNLNEVYCTEKPQMKTQDNNIHLIKTYDIRVPTSVFSSGPLDLQILNFVKL